MRKFFFSPFASPNAAQTYFFFFFLFSLSCLRVSTPQFPNQRRDGVRDQLSGESLEGGGGDGAGGRESEKEREEKRGRKRLSWSRRSGEHHHRLALE